MPHACQCLRLWTIPLVIWLNFCSTLKWSGSWTIWLLLVPSNWNTLFYFRFVTLFQLKTSFFPYLSLKALYLEFDCLHVATDQLLLVSIWQDLLCMCRGGCSPEQRAWVCGSYLKLWAMLYLPHTKSFPVLCRNWCSESHLKWYWYVVFLVFSPRYSKRAGLWWELQVLAWSKQMVGPQWLLKCPNSGQYLISKFLRCYGGCCTKYFVIQIKCFPPNSSWKNDSLSC